LLVRDFLAARRITPELPDAIRQRFGVFRLDKDTIANDLGNRRGARRHNRLACRHGFEESDPEAFLHAGQAEDVRAVILAGEAASRHLADPGDDGFELKIAPACVKRCGFRTAAGDPDFEVRNPAAQHVGGFEQ